MPEKHILDVDAPTRLDQLLARRWGELDRAQIREMITEGRVSINGETARKLGQRLQPGDVVVVQLPELEKSEAPTPPPGLALSIAYEDEHLLVVDKPAGIPVRRSPRSRGGQDHATLPQLLAERYPGQAHVGGVNRAGVVTTLDEDASGLVLAGRDESMYRELRRMVKRQYVTEVYTALVEGHLRGEYTIDQPIGNARHTRGRLVVAREGRPAQTYVRGQQHYKESGRDYTLVYVRPESERMHQIRVHLSWYGFPIVGDRVYGSNRQPMLPDRLFLHLSVVSLLHPVTDLELRVESELPPELHSVLSYMRRPKY
ncbi:MAG: RluA family pseudouridine synthase [Anaerolineae bacterium]